MSRKVAVLVNPSSGRGKGAKAVPEIEITLRALGCDPVMLIGDSAEESAAMARGAVEGGVDALVAVGGDGTLNLALQHVAGTETPLGLIALGTGNDNARLLGLPRNDPAAGAGVISRFNVRTVDVASVECADGSHSWFLGVLSTGFDSVVTDRANAMTWPKGHARYILAMFRELIAFQPVPFTMTLDGETLAGRGMLAAVGNGVSYGGGMRVCEGAAIDDGLLNITWLHEASKFEFIKTFPKVFQGAHLDNPNVTSHSAREVRIESPGMMAYADGEPMGPLPAVIRVHPGALKVLVP